jgi:hypothetical protein
MRTAAAARTRQRGKLLFMHHCVGVCCRCKRLAHTTRVASPLCFNHLPFALHSAILCICNRLVCVLHVKYVTYHCHCVSCRRATTSVGDNDEEGGSDMDTDDAQGGAAPGSRGRVSHLR